VKDTTVVVVTYNSQDHIGRCLDSLIGEECIAKVVVVDNASVIAPTTLESEYAGKGLAVSVIMMATNLGFAGGCNIGACAVETQFVLFLNPDTIVLNHAVDASVQKARKTDRLGVMGCRLVDAGGQHQTSVFRVPTPWNDFLTSLGLTRMMHSIEPCGAGLTEVQGFLTGAFLLMQRDVFFSIGKFRDDYFMYAEDVDLCYALLRKGLRVLYNADDEVVHFGNQAGAAAFGDQRLKHVYASLMRFQRNYWHGWFFPAFCARALGLGLRYLVFPGRHDSYRMAFVANCSAFCDVRGRHEQAGVQ
jgi:N-acetylglucosaminyl-diphospho-decaprenol L-rhamnosyltransferase